MSLGHVLKGWWLSLSVVLLHPSPFTFPICTWLFQMPFCKAQHFSAPFPQTFRFGRCCVCKLRNRPIQCPPGLILLLGVLFYTVGAFGEIFSHNLWLNLTLTVLITRYYQLLVSTAQQLTSVGAETTLSLWAFKLQPLQMCFLEGAKNLLLLKS